MSQIYPYPSKYPNSITYDTYVHVSHYILCKEVPPSSDHSELKQSIQLGLVIMSQISQLSQSYGGSKKGGCLQIIHVIFDHLDMGQN